MPAITLAINTAHRSACRRSLRRSFPNVYHSRKCTTAIITALSSRRRRRSAAALASSQRKRGGRRVRICANVCLSVFVRFCLFDFYVHLLCAPAFQCVLAAAAVYIKSFVVTHFCKQPTTVPPLNTHTHIQTLKKCTNKVCPREAEGAEKLTKNRRMCVAFLFVELSDRLYGRTASHAARIGTTRDYTGPGCDFGLLCALRLAKNKVR